MPIKGGSEDIKRKKNTEAAGNFVKKNIFLHEFY